MTLQIWGCTKGAEKASCGETVVQKGVLESPSLLFPLKGFRRFRAKLTGPEKKRSDPLARSEGLKNPQIKK